MVWFAQTPEEVALHSKLIVVVDGLRKSLLDSIDGEWGWIEASSIRLLRAVPGLRNLSVHLTQEVEDGEAARISHDEADEIAASVGQYIDGCDWPDEPNWGDPRIQYELAKFRIATGEWIWADEDADDIIGPRKYGPITLEEYKQQQAALTKHLRQRILGLASRNVQ